MNLENLLACSFTLALVGTACGSTATITTARTEYEVEIVGGTADKLIVKTESGQRATVSRREIKDIDHPGNVAATIGAIVGVYGILNITAGAPSCDTYGSAFCAGVFAPAALGVGLVLYGFVVWDDSASAAKSKAGNLASRLHLAPTPMVAQTGLVPGLSMGGRF